MQSITSATKPLLSIITVNYNNRVGLISTIDSVINQTWKEFEYIVIDGGSNDGSKEEIEKKAQFINYWVSEKDGGIYQGMNKGISKASGKYLLFLNSGDYLIENDFLQSHFLQNSEGDFDLISYSSINKNKKVSINGGLSFQDLKWTYLPHNSTFILSRLFNELGNYSEKYKIGSDADWFLKLFQRGNVNLKVVDHFCTRLQSIGISKQHSWQNDKELIIRRWKYFKDWKFPIWLFREKLMGRWPPNYD